MTDVSEIPSKEEILKNMAKHLQTNGKTSANKYAGW
jgi:hypothetical protein